MPVIRFNQLFYVASLEEARKLLRACPIVKRSTCSQEFLYFRVVESLLAVGLLLRSDLVMMIKSSSTVHYLGPHSTPETYRLCSALSPTEGSLGSGITTLRSFSQEGHVPASEPKQSRTR